MHPMTVSNLQSAFSGESQAHMRYLAYSAKAKRDGFPNVGRLFEAVAWAEQIHATSHFTVLRNETGPALTVAGGGFGLGSTSENLAVALEGEHFEIEEMYPVYKAAAEFQAERTALRSLDWAGEAEKTHHALFEQAKQSVDAGNDIEFEQVLVCERCGHTVLDSAPDTCPICKAKKEAYHAF